MKSLEQFLSDLNGNFCEVSGSSNAKNQCVDLANAYLRDVCNHQIIQWTNACDFPSKIKDMEWIPNDEETDLPIEGDIIIWNSKVGGSAGHIAIFLEGTTSKFNSFDQNWPLYSPCHVQSHSYSNVIGWLRPNGIIQEDMTDEQKRILEFLNGKTEGDVREAFGALADIPKLNKEIADLKTSQKDLTERIEQLEADAKANNDLIVSYQSSISTAKDTESNLRADIQIWKNRYESKCKETPDKLSAFELIKLGIQKLLIKK